MSVSHDPGRIDGFARQLFEGLVDRYDRLAEVLSLGQNRRWRSAMVDKVAVCQPALTLDVATGPAGVALHLAPKTGGSVIGIDLTPAMLRRAAQNVARSEQRDRIALLAGRAERLPFPPGSFDGLTFTYLLRYVADPAGALAELSRVVRPGGVVASLDFYVPDHPFWRSLWWVYTRAVLPVAGYITGGPEWYKTGRFLGASISGHYEQYPLQWHVEAWQAAGIQDVRTRVMSLGGGVVMWGRKN